MEKLKIKSRTMTTKWTDAIMHDGHIEGKAKLILTNVKTGKQEIIVIIVHKSS